MKRIVFLLVLALSGFDILAQETVSLSCNPAVTKDSIAVAETESLSTNVPSVLPDSSLVVNNVLESVSADKCVKLDSLRNLIVCKNDTINELRGIITCKNDTLLSLGDTVALKNRELELLEKKLQKANKSIDKLKKKPGDKELKKQNENFRAAAKKDSALIVALRADSLRNVEYRIRFEAFIKEFERAEAKLVCDSILQKPFSCIETETLNELSAWVATFVADSVVPEHKKDDREKECVTFQNVLTKIHNTKNYKRCLALCDSLLSAEFNAEVVNRNVKSKMKYAWKHLNEEQQNEFTERYHLLDRYADAAIILDSVLNVVNKHHKVCYCRTGLDNAGVELIKIREGNALEVIRDKFATIDTAQYEGVPFMVALYRKYIEVIENNPLKIKVEDSKESKEMDVDAVETIIRRVAEGAKKYKK